MPKSMSQMSSPEWLRGGRTAQPPKTPKCTQVGTKMFTWSTTPMSRSRRESRNIERKGQKKGRVQGRE